VPLLREVSVPVPEGWGFVGLICFPSSKFGQFNV